jgi:Protein of unknown function (DUF3048) N-terminal domain/Protein of unknown function (DUF3048) C-terminal domain
MVWNRRSVGLVALGVVAAGALVVGGISLASDGSPSKPVAAPTPSATPTPSPTATGPLRSPFTGKRVSALHRVLAVKIGNTVPERPPTGLTKADLVYVIPVEGGLSRLLAVFSTHFPSVIGPVRSARADDLRLLRQFGRPGFAFSGAQPFLLPVVEHAHIVNLYDGAVGGYFRSTNRFAPYNLYARTRRLLAESRHASMAHNIGFRFGAAPPGGRVVHAKSVSYPAASFRFTWSAAKRRWMVWMDGSRARAAEGGQLGAPTVVIQYTRVRTSGYLEADRRPPYAVTVGHGRALVLRDGRAYRAHWIRRHASGGTRFTLPSGQPMTFARGPVWIVLAYR